MPGARRLIRLGAPTASTGRIVTRSEGGSGMPELELRFSPFGKWYEVHSRSEGRFLERTVKGAFAGTIRDLRNSDGTYAVKTLFNHGADQFIGDKLLGTVRYLAEQADSPVMRVALFDTSFNRDLLDGFKAGVYGSSFMFTVDRDIWDHSPKRSAHNPTGLPERSIYKVNLVEAGPVTWPANPAATAKTASGSASQPRHKAQSVDALQRAATLARIAYLSAKSTAGGRLTQDVRRLALAYEDAQMAYFKAKFGAR